MTDELMREGYYRARAGDPALGHSSTGKEQIAVMFTITEDCEYNGKRLAWYGYFTDAAFDITLKALRAMGWKGHDLNDLSTVGSKESSVVVKHEVYKGETKVRIAFVNELGGGMLKDRMGEADAQSFASRMKGKILALEAGKSQEDSSDVAGEVADDDDIPF